VYALIAISLMLAYFLGINIVASAASAVVWAMLRKRSLNWNPRTRANVTFFLRTLPPLFAFALIAAFILPAYLIFEPMESGETVSAKLAIVVVAALLAASLAVLNVAIGYLRTRKLLRSWTTRSEPVASIAAPTPVRSLRHPLPLVAVLGVSDPQIFISANLLDELNGDELAAAIAHESGHIAARDNLKRVVMRACSNLLFLPIGRAIDIDWSASAELAADEYAAGALGRRGSVDLASALVKIGKLTPGGGQVEPAFASSIVGGQPGTLTHRIERLLELADAPDDIPGVPLQQPLIRIKVWVALASGALLPFALGIEFLAIVHAATESLLHMLS
jgi:Zn-dependent protease with chaperone function